MPLKVKSNEYDPMAMLPKPKGASSKNKSSGSTRTTHSLTTSPSQSPFPQHNLAPHRSSRWSTTSITKDPAFLIATYGNVSVPEQSNPSAGQAGQPRTMCAHNPAQDVRVTTICDSPTPSLIAECEAGVMKAAADAFYRKFGHDFLQWFTPERQKQAGCHAIVDFATDSQVDRKVPLDGRKSRAEERDVSDTASVVSGASMETRYSTTDLGRMADTVGAGDIIPHGMKRSASPFDSSGPSTSKAEAPDFTPKVYFSVATTFEPTTGTGSLGLTKPATSVLGSGVNPDVYGDSLHGQSVSSIKLDTTVSKDLEDQARADNIVGREESGSETPDAKDTAAAETGDSIGSILPSEFPEGISQSDATPPALNIPSTMTETEGIPTDSGAGSPAESKNTSDSPQLGTSDSVTEDKTATEPVLGKAPQEVSPVDEEDLTLPVLKGNLFVAAAPKVLTEPTIVQAVTPAAEILKREVVHCQTKAEADNAPQAKPAVVETLSKLVLTGKIRSPNPSRDPSPARTPRDDPKASTRSGSTSHSGSSTPSVVDPAVVMKSVRPAASMDPKDLPPRQAAVYQFMTQIKKMNPEECMRIVLSKKDYPSYS